MPTGNPLQFGFQMNNNLFMSMSHTIDHIFFMCVYICPKYFLGPTYTETVICSIWKHDYITRRHISWLPEWFFQLCYGLDSIGFNYLCSCLSFCSLSKFYFSVSHSCLHQNISIENDFVHTLGWGCQFLSPFVSMTPDAVCALAYGWEALIHLIYVLVDH